MDLLANTEIIVTVIAIVVPFVITAFVLFAVARIFKGLAKARANEMQLIQNGTPAEGRVLQMGTGGMTVTRGVQRSVQLNLALEVMKAGSSPYRVQMSPLVPEIAISRIVPGAVVPVKVSPQDQSKVAIDLPAMGFMV